MVSIKGTAPAVKSAVSAARSKKEKTPKVSKPKSPSHPTYFAMIGDAILALKERTGSSQYTITKYIEQKHQANLPPNFKKMMLFHLKKLVASGKLLKIKNSFKVVAAMPLSVSKKPALSKPAAAKPKKTTASKPKPAVAENKRPVAKVSSKPKPMKKLAPVKANKPKSVKSPAKKVKTASARSGRKATK